MEFDFGTLTGSVLFLLVLVGLGEFYKSLLKGKDEFKTTALIALLAASGVALSLFQEVGLTALQGLAGGLAAAGAIKTIQAPFTAIGKVLKESETPELG